MGKTIELTIRLNNDLGITAAVVTYNDTGLPSDSELIRLTANALLKSIELNKEDMKIGDLLSSLDINNIKKGN